MAEKRWTPEQLDAISSRGGTVLVSAAAGSGKTAVLVERVIRRLTGPQPCDADRLLVVTFTNAAAAEMKERISLRLAELVAENPADRNLQRQQILLQNAHISTIHAFCLDLIRENFEKLDISPDFRIADENEIRLLSRDVLAQILEERYAAGREKADCAFLTLAETIGAGRDDSLLEDTVLRLYDFARSLPDPEGWLDGVLRMYDASVPVGRTVWGGAALRHVRQTMESAVHAVDGSIAMMDGYEPLIKSYRPAFLADRRQAQACAQAAAAGDWDAVFRAVDGFDFMSLGAVRKFEPAELKEAVQARRKDFKQTVERLRAGVLCGDSAQTARDIRTVYPLAVCLHDIVLELNRRLFAEKQKRDILDFSDLEQLTLKLLYEDTGHGLQPGPAARAVAARFEEVLVDEYQDTNRAQDAIFQAVSKQGRNLFMVGDVKQSIYRFRKATPELFMEKKAAYAPYGAGAFPARIILGRNFRSRAGVTAGVNFVFSQLMSEQFGEIEYGQEEQLIPAAVYPPRDGADFALHLVDAGGDGGEADDADTREARHVASVIAGMVRGGFPVQGEDGPRPARFRDFCVLLRSPAGRAETYRRELERAGVPVFADVNGGYLGSYEVGVMLSLLRLLDNPLQDVPLLSVMLSPVFGFTPDDLARVRVRNRKGSLYLAVAAAARQEGGRLGEFIESLAGWRRLAVVLPADRLILRVYADASFLEICGAMPGGAARRANLRLLLDYARGYEAAGYKGLSGFIRYIDRLSERDGDLVPASAVSENANVVRIMSIHKSKGLEFPVCLLAGCAHRFNMTDTQSAALFHPEYGFGCTVRDPALNCRYTTLPREAIRIETARSTLAEEMRVLYVAMTRAKEKLICVMAPSNPQTLLRRAASLIRPGESRLDPLAASQAQNFAQWLLACALRHPDAGELRRAAGCEDLPLLPAAAPLEIRFAGPGAEPEEPSRTARAALPESPAAEDAALADDIRRRMAFRYPGAGLTRVPSKVAVSEFAEEDTRAQFGFHGSRPQFLARTGLTPAQAGTALHAFLQYADLPAVAESGNVAEEVRRLVAEDFLLPEQGEAVRADRVLAYLRSDIYARIRGAGRVWKEFRFTVETDAAEVSDAVAPGQGSVVLQGMADVVFEENGRLYLLDYKTDAADETELRQRYAGQLAIYARAVAQIMGKEVTARYIYGFHEGKTMIL